MTIALFCLIFAYNAVREKRGYVDTPAEKGLSNCVYCFTDLKYTAS